MICYIVVAVFGDKLNASVIRVEQLFDKFAKYPIFLFWRVYKLVHIFIEPILKFNRKCNYPLQ